MAKELNQIDPDTTVRGNSVARKISSAALVSGAVATGVAVNMFADSVERLVPLDLSQGEIWRISLIFSGVLLAAAGYQLRDEF